MVANLKRYDPFTISDQGYRQSAFMGECGDGEYVKFEEAMEASSNSLRQLKVEIAAIADDINIAVSCHDHKQYNSAMIRLRKLSAI